jgi:hypothetical protein
VNVPEDADARRSFVCPPRTGVLRGIDLAYLDPADPDERHLLILADHPELQSAIEREEREVKMHGQTINPFLHIAMHEVVANQLWDDNPPEAWRTAQRLLGMGYARHDVLHMMASVVSDQLYDALQQHRVIDLENYEAALGALPDSWEAMRPADNTAHRRPRPRRTTGRTKRRRRGR